MMYIIIVLYFFRKLRLFIINDQMKITDWFNLRVSQLLKIIGVSCEWTWPGNEITNWTFDLGQMMSSKSYNVTIAILCLIYFHFLPCLLINQISSFSF